MANSDAGWMADGLCVRLPVEVADAWFFDDTGSGLGAALCAACPVAELCAKWGEGRRTGMWGGRTQPVKDS